MENSLVQNLISVYYHLLDLKNKPDNYLRGYDLDEDVIIIRETIEKLKNLKDSL